MVELVGSNMQRRSFLICVLLNLTVGACALHSIGDQSSGQTRTSGQDIPAAILVSHKEVTAHRLTPHEAIRTRRRGGRFPWPQIQLEAVADENGDVTYVHVTSTYDDGLYPGWEEFFPKAIDVAKSWKFRSFERNGKPVAARFLEYVNIVPPEQLPTTHVPFPEIQDWNKLQITLERTSCFGTCPAYKVEIHGDGSMVYTGTRFVPITGEHRDHISREAVEQIVEAFRRADYFSLRDKYIQSVTDNATYRTSISIGGQTKSVTNYVGEEVGMPQTVTDLENAIDHVADTAKWIRGDAATLPALKSENWNFNSPQAATTLVRIARLGSADAVRELIAAGVAVNGKDEVGSGPLAAAVCGEFGYSNDNFGVIPVLIEAGAGRDNPAEMNKALICAARAGDLDATRLLLKAGASPEATDNSGNAPLIEAASSGVPQVVEEVLKQHPNINARNQMGKTAIFAAAVYYVSWEDHDIDHPAVIRLLAKSGADLNAQDQDGNTALHVTHDLDSAKALIQLGARINILNNEGDTPLINTCSAEVAKLLIHAGADPATRNIHGLTALDFALVHNWKGKVEALQAAQPRKQQE